MNIRKKVRGLSTREKKKISNIFIISGVISFQSVKKPISKGNRCEIIIMKKLGLNV